MRDEVVVEYVDLCERLAATEIVERADQPLYDRLDHLWYLEMSDDERDEAEDRLVAGARAWHNARHHEEP